MGMELVEQVEVGAGGVASINFAAIPQDALDLQILLSGSVLTGGMNIDMRFNNNSGASYYLKKLYGTGTGVGSISLSSDSKFTLQATGSPSGWDGFSNATIYIPNYAGTQNKSVQVDAVNENNGTGAFQEFYGALWLNSSAISSIQLLGDGGNNIAQYTIASLYKVTNA